MASVKHRAEYALVRLLTGMAQRRSPEAADRLGVRLGRLAHRLVRSRRTIAHDNLQKAFGDSLSETDIHDIIRRVFENIGRTLIELARFPLLTPDRANQIVVPTPLEPLREQLARGGGVLVVPHFGNWELLGVWSRVQELPVEVLVTTQHNLLVDAHLTKLRQSAGVKIIRAGSSVRQLFKALKGGKLVALASDQHATSGGLIVDFFGRPAAAPEGPALLALRANVPIFPFCMRRERFDRHVIMAGDPIVPPRAGDEATAIRAMTRHYMAFFEQWIRAYPDQWLWTHRRWKLPDRPQLSDGQNVEV